MRYAVCGHEIEIEDDERVVFPAAGIRVGDIARYYVAVWPWLEPYLHDRPIVYETFFTTFASPNTFEQDPPDETPRWVKRVRVRGRERDVSYVVADSPATLVYLVKLRMVTLHVWMSRKRTIGKPDFALFDLDPVGDTPARTTAAAAMYLRDALGHVGVENPIVKTSGRGGLHVYVPLVPELDYRAVRAFVESIAAAAARRAPRVFTLEREVAHRPAGRIFIDARQMGRGMTIVPPFSIRACEGAPVAMPVAWTDVERWSKSRAKDLPSFSADEALALLRDGGDPWEWKPVRLSTLV